MAQDWVRLPVRYKCGHTRDVFFTAGSEELIARSKAAQEADDCADCHIRRHNEVLRAKYPELYGWGRKG